MEKLRVIARISGSEIGPEEFSGMLRNQHRKYKGNHDIFRNQQDHHSDAMQPKNKAMDQSPAFCFFERTTMAGNANISRNAALNCESDCRKRGTLERAISASFRQSPLPF
jgi:hypothetical protein